jgi:RNA recognition motif-containing protein
MTLYVSNLAEATTREELAAAFTQHGKVRSVTMPGDRMKSGRAAGPNRGYCFVVMPDKVQARAAVTALHQKSLGGQAVSVQVARPRWTPSYPS